MIQGVSEKSFFSSGRISFTVFYPFIYLWEKIIEEDFNQNILNLSSFSYDTSKSCVPYLLKQQKVSFI